MKEASFAGYKVKKYHFTGWDWQSHKLSFGHTDYKMV